MYLFELYTLITPVWLPPCLIETVDSRQFIAFQMFNKALYKSQQVSEGPFSTPKRTNGTKLLKSIGLS